MQFWKIAGSRNSVFCRTKRVSEDGWGRFAARRLRSGLGCTGIMVGSADRPLSGTAASGIVLHWASKFKRKIRKSCTKASFSRERKLRFHIFNFSEFVGRLARKLCFDIFNCQFFWDVSHEGFVFTSSIFLFLRDASQESFVFTSSAFRFWGMSRTKALLSHLPLSLFEGLWGSSRATASFSHLPLTLFARSCTKCGLER